MEKRAIDLERFNVWADMIDRNRRLSNEDKAAMKIKAWAYCASTKNFLGIMLDLGRIM